MKLAWIYLCDNCDHAGVWEVNLRIMNFELGTELTLTDLRDCFGDKIVWISDNKTFLPSFLDFQYGELNPQNRVHRSVIQRLSLLNLWSDNKVHISPLEGANNKDKDIDKDKDKDRKIDADFLSAYLKSIDESPTIRSIPKQTKLLWHNLYGDHDFILRSVAGALPRYKNQPPSKQNAEVFFTDQLKFDWLHFQKIQKQNATPGGMVADL